MSAAKQIPIVCPGHTRPLAELQFLSIDNNNNKETLLISACHDRMPMLRNGTSGDWIGTWQGHKGAVWSCQLDATGSLCATASGDFSAKLWDGITGQALCDLPHKHIVKTCVFSPNSQHLATGGKEAVLRIYDLQRCLLKDKPDTHPLVEIKQEAPISKCVFLNDTRVLVALVNGKCCIWNMTDKKLLKEIVVSESMEEIRDIEICATADGTKVLSVAAGEHVYFYDLADHSLLHSYKMPIHFREEGGVSLHPSGDRFVAGGSDLWVRVFNFKSGEELECNKGHHGPIRCVRYSPDGASYATGSEDGTIRLWQTFPKEE